MSTDQEQANLEHQALIDQFVEISGVDRDRARFYLETAAYDLPLAVSGFFEGGFDRDDEQPEVVFDREDADDDVQIIEEPDDEELVSTGSLHQESTNQLGIMSGKGGGKPSQDPKKKVATLFSQGGPSNADESSDESGDEKGQAFYVGGSEESGQQVLGPPKKKGDNVAERFFQQARERGAEQIDASQRAAASGGAGSSSRFGGVGYRLGDAVKPSEKIGGEAATGEQSTGPAVVTVIMRMWRNGFTIDDEPLRSFEDPVNRQFLQHIMQHGRLPPELIHMHRGKQIDLEMEDHHHEDYKPPKRAVKAFSGQGHTLGSPVPDVVGAGKVGEKAASASASAANVDASTIPVDELKPVTNIQVRLGNGDRLAMKLNHHHTISDLRQFICQLRPDLASRPFMLMTSFPSKELTDESSTLEEANLLNAVIIQRFK